MEHTKKFVLVDPRFVRPSMRDKVLSELDSNISQILNSDESDEIKAKNYISTLSRFRNYSTPQTEKTKEPTPSVPTSIPGSTPSPIRKEKLKRPLKGVKRQKIEPLDLVVDPLADPSLWRRTRQTRTKKRFGTQWIEYNGSTKKKTSPTARNKSWLVL